MHFLKSMRVITRFYFAKHTIVKINLIIFQTHVHPSLHVSIPYLERINLIF